MAKRERYKYDVSKEDPFYSMVYNMSMSDLMKEYKRTASTVNSRIYRLKKGGYDMPRGEMSYKLHMDMRQNMIRDPQKLIEHYKNEHPKATVKSIENHLRQWILTGYRFKQSAWTTIKGRKQIGAKVKATFREKGLDLSDKQMDKLLRAIPVLKDLEKFNYTEVFELVATAKKSTKRFTDEMLDTILDEVLGGGDTDSAKDKLIDNLTTKPKGKRKPVLEMTYEEAEKMFNKNSIPYRGKFERKYDI